MNDLPNETICPQPSGDWQGQRQERHRPAFTLIVRPHDEDHIFDRHVQNETSESTPNTAASEAPPAAPEGLSERVDRALPADVAEDHA